MPGLEVLQILPLPTTYGDVMVTLYTVGSPDHNST
jgi:hypothetical protein